MSSKVQDFVSLRELVQIKLLVYLNQKVLQLGQAVVVSPVNIRSAISKS